ncbi:MAG TPA: hypothetical protein VL358_15625 [Caulobacteraceae bacterium]|jgi:hypothetical protein|nr:hypothetical protein [Caulobacteraceae bacterium]
MASQAEDLNDLRQRVEVLEALVAALRGRIEDLEAVAGGALPAYQMSDQEPTV